MSFGYFGKVVNLRWNGLRKRSSACADRIFQDELGQKGSLKIAMYRSWISLFKQLWFIWTNLSPCMKEWASGLRIQFERPGGSNFTSLCAAVRPNAKSGASGCSPGNNGCYVYELYVCKHVMYTVYRYIVSIHRGQLLTISGISCFMVHLQCMITDKNGNHGFSVSFYDTPWYIMHCNVQQ